MALQLLIFDTRRGNTEGLEEDKVLAAFPNDVPLLHQSGMAGLLQGLLLFTANFTAALRPRWDVAETDSGTWVMLEAEPHLWFVVLAPRAWVPRHTTEDTLHSLLTQIHLLNCALCGSVQAALDEDPSGGLARAGLQAVVDHVGHALGSPHTWQHRELRNPLGDAALPPLLPLSQGSSLAVQGLANHLLLASLHGQQCVRGVLLLYGPYLLWSSLAPRDTAALFAVVAAGLLHASSSSKGGSGGGGGVGEPHAAASAAAVAALPSLRALDGGAWRQLPSGFLVLRGSADAPGGGVWPAYGAPTVPLVHLQHSPDEREGEQGGAGGGGGQPGACRLLPLLEGRLLVGLLLDDGALATPQQLAGLHGLVAAPARQLAAQVGEEVRASKAEAAHLPGFRYLYQDAAVQAARASPRIKVSAMSHHARTLAAAVRGSLGGLVAAGAEAVADAGEAPPDGLAGGEAFQAQQAPPSTGSGATGGGGEHEVLEVVARSSQECWAYALQPGDGRRLLAVRERRGERELGQASGVLHAFAEDNFLM